MPGPNGLGAAVVTSQGCILLARLEGGTRAGRAVPPPVSAPDPQSSLPASSMTHLPSILVHCTSQLPRAIGWGGALATPCVDVSFCADVVCKHYQACSQLSTRIALRHTRANPRGPSGMQLLQPVECWTLLPGVFWAAPPPQGLGSHVQKLLPESSSD